MSEQVRAFGLVMLCVLAVGAIAASGAAAVPTQSNTGFTCVEAEAGAGEFTNADCSSKEGSPKNWKHVAIPAGESTPLTTATTETWEYRVPLGGPEIILKSPKVECLECALENHQEVIGGKTWMDVQSTSARLRFAEVSSNTSGCFVKGGAITTEPLKITSTTAGNLLVEPVSGTHLAIVKWEPGCVFGEFPIDGHFNGTLTGAKMKVNTVKGEVFFGAAGHEAFLKGGATLSVGGKAAHPLSLTPS